MHVLLHIEATSDIDLRSLKNKSSLIFGSPYKLQQSTAITEIKFSTVKFRQLDCKMKISVKTTNVEIKGIRFNPSDF